MNSSRFYSKIVKTRLFIIFVIQSKFNWASKVNRYNLIKIIVSQVNLTGEHIHEVICVCLLVPNSARSDRTSLRLISCSFCKKKILIINVDFDSLFFGLFLKLPTDKYWYSELHTSFPVITQSWQCWHFCIGLINHFQCILIRRTLYNVVNFVFYGKTR